MSESLLTAQSELLPLNGTIVLFGGKDGKLGRGDSILLCVQVHLVHFNSSQDLERVSVSIMMSHSFSFTLVDVDLKIYH